MLKTGVAFTLLLMMTTMLLCHAEQTNSTTRVRLNLEEEEELKERIMATQMLEEYMKSIKTAEEELHAYREAWERYHASATEEMQKVVSIMDQHMEHLDERGLPIDPRYWEQSKEFQKALEDEDTP